MINLIELIFAQLLIVKGICMEPNNPQEDKLWLILSY